MYDENDAAADAAYEQLSEEIIDQFKAELVHLALMDSSPSVDRVRIVLSEAAKVRPVSPTAAYLFAASAAEICFKKLLLEPLVRGLIHNEIATPLIANAILSRTSFERIKALVIRLVNAAAKIDLATHVRQGAKVEILVEANTVAKRRNEIIHRGEMADDAEADHALAVAIELLDGVFAAVLREFRLRMLKDGETRARWHDKSLIVQLYG